MVITKVSSDDRWILRELMEEGVRVVVEDSPHTSSFHTVYGRSLDERYLEVTSVADPFIPEDIGQCGPAKYIYMGPLTTKDFTPEFLVRARKVAPVILDVQGFTREVRDKRIVYTDWSWKSEGMRSVDIFKADIKEADIISGFSEPLTALKELLGLGPREVILLWIRVCT